MSLLYTPSNWYWLVAGTPGWFSSVANAFVQTLPQGFVPTPIGSQQALWDVLQAANVPLPQGATSTASPPLLASLSGQVATLNAKVGIAASAQALA